MSYFTMNSAGLHFKYGIGSFVSVALFIAVGSPAYAAAPQQLHGKSIVLNWSETRHQRDQADNGMWSEWKDFVATYKLSVYVGETGRLFMRQVGTTPLGSVTTDEFAGKGKVPSFSGQTMTIIEPGSGGVRRLIVNVDAGNSSCTARIATGYEAGKTRVVFSPLTKHNIEIQVALAGAAACSIQAGNVLQ